MFDWLKGRRGRTAPFDDVRELLFGDVPLAEWAARRAGAPWQRFRSAADAVARGDRQEAERELAGILAMPNLETRHYAQAWTALRDLGITPPPGEATHLFGIVLDVPMAGGRDTLAVYDDGSARYLNGGGSAAVYDAVGADEEIDERVQAVLMAGRPVAEVVGVWSGARPSLAPGLARVTALTLAGLRFGEGPLDVLSREPAAGPIFAAGAALLQVLSQRVRSDSAAPSA